MPEAFGDFVDIQSGDVFRAGKFVAMTGLLFVFTAAFYIESKA
jgi:hypothetical protein